jgi:hypothetical protein
MYKQSKNNKENFFSLLTKTIQPKALKASGKYSGGYSGKKTRLGKTANTSVKYSSTSRRQTA